MKIVILYSEKLAVLQTIKILSANNGRVGTNIFDQIDLVVELNPEWSAKNIQQLRIHSQQKQTDVPIWENSFAKAAARVANILMIPCGKILCCQLIYFCRADLQRCNFEISPDEHVRRLIPRSVNSDLIEVTCKADQRRMNAGLKRMDHPFRACPAANDFQCQDELRVVE